LASKNRFPFPEVAGEAALGLVEVKTNLVINPPPFITKILKRRKSRMGGKVFQTSPHNPIRWKHLREPYVVFSYLAPDQERIKGGR